MFNNFSPRVPEDLNQRATIKHALELGFRQILATPMQPKYAAFLKPFNDFFKKIHNGYFLDKPMEFSDDQEKLYEITHTDKFAPAERLFLEFMLGLCRFSLSITIYLKFADFLLERNSFPPIVIDRSIECRCTYCMQQDPIWQPLHRIANLGKFYITEIIKVTDNFKRVGFWEMATAFFTLLPNYEQLAKQLVSMQRIPKDEKILLGLAQTLHWGGFGGSGIFLQPYQQLKPLLEHRIGYHDREAGGFNARLVIRFETLNKMKDYANATTSKLLLEKFPEDSTIEMLDVGSGPEHLAVKDIIETLQEQGRTVRLTASEVDVSGIESLQELKSEPNSPITDVRFFDLNFISTHAIDMKEVVIDQFDMVMARLVLHQLSFSDIKRALEFFTTVTKPDGYIINPDVGPKGYYQVLMVPANNVDREGFVPSWMEHNFVKTAVKLSDGTSKIAFPRIDICQAFPTKDIPLDTYTAYQVKVVPTTHVAQINMLWETQQYAKAKDLAGVF